MRQPTIKIPGYGDFPILRGSLAFYEGGIVMFDGLLRITLVHNSETKSILDKETAQKFSGRIKWHSITNN